MISENTNLSRIIIKFLIFLTELLFVIIRGSKDIMTFIYHVNLRNRVIKGICGFVVANKTPNHTFRRSSLIATGHVKIFFICHVT